MHRDQHVLPNVLLQPENEQLLCDISTETLYGNITHCVYTSERVIPHGRLIPFRNPCTTCADGGYPNMVHIEREFLKRRKPTVYPVNSSPPFCKRDYKGTFIWMVQSGHHSASVKRTRNLLLNTFQWWLIFSPKAYFSTNLFLIKEEVANVIIVIREICFM